MKYLASAAFMLMSAPAISFAMAIEMLSQGSDDNNMVFAQGNGALILLIPSLGY